MPTNENKVNVWQKNNTESIFLNSNKTSEEVEQCCRQCMNVSPITSADDAFSAKGFEDYLIDEMFFKRSNVTNSSRTKRDLATESLLAAVQGNMSSTSPAKSSPSSPHDRTVQTITQTILINDRSIKLWSATFSNLTHYTSYDIVIRACLSPSSGKTSCSDPPAGIRHRTKPLRKFITLCLVYLLHLMYSFVFQLKMITCSMLR